MKIKLPVTLRSALLAAMALSAGTAYSAPFDPSTSSAPPSGSVNGLLVGDSSAMNYTTPSDLTVMGDVVVGAGDRNGQTGGNGALTIQHDMNVIGNVYAGASGVNSFPGYVTGNAHGGEGSISLAEEKTLSVSGAVRLGWLDGKTGSMTIEGTMTTGGQIVLGFYHQQGGPSLGTTGELTIQNGGSVTAGREIFIASGTMSATGENSTVSGKHLELVGRESTSVNVSNKAQAQFDSILIGSYGNQSVMTLSNQAEVTSQTNFQISAGLLKLESKAAINVDGDAWFGNRVADNGGIDSTITLDASSFHTTTLSVWQDASLQAGNQSDISAKEMQMNGRVQLNNSSLDVTGTLRLLDGAHISSDNGSLKSISTQSHGNVLIEANGSGIKLGNTNVASGTLTLNAKDTNGEIAADSLTTGGGNLVIGSNATLNATLVSVSEGTSVSLMQNASADLEVLDLYGNLSTAGTVTAANLSLYQGGKLTVAPTGKIAMQNTVVYADFSLADTSVNNGTLGNVTLSENVVLELKGNNAASAVTTGKNNTVTVSGGGNALGNVTIDATSRLLVEGADIVQAESLKNQGTVDITGTLQITGTGDQLHLTGTTTVSGSLTGAAATWNNANAPITLLINDSTANGGTMLTLQSGLTSDSFVVKVDMTNGIEGLSGKKVTFAQNGDTAVTFNKEGNGNFSFLSGGTVSEEYDSDTHIRVVQEIGSAKTYYGYTVLNGTVSENSTNWNATGIQFDNNYSNVYDGAKEQLNQSIIVEHVQVATEKVTDINNDTYGKVNLGETETSPGTVVSKNVKVNGSDANPLNISSQVVKLDKGNDEVIPIATGTKTWEVTEETAIVGASDKDSSVGGLKDEIVVGDDKIEANQIGQLNIAAGKTLTLENTTVEIDRTLSMGQGAAIAAKDATITIGTTERTLDLEQDVSFEVPKYGADGQPVTDAQGNVVMETVTLSTELNQKSIDNIALNLEDSTFQFDKFTTTANGQEIKDALNDKVVFNNATVVTKETEDGKMQLGGGSAQMIFNNSTISGTGTLDNVVMNGGSLRIGNSPGVLNVTGGSYSHTGLDFLIDPEKTIANGVNADATSSNAMVSQLNLAGSTTLTGVVLNIYMETLDPATGAYVSIPNSTTQYLDKFTEGTSFQLITGIEGNLNAGSSFTVGSLPTLQDGLVWDTSKLFTEGTIEIAKGSYADAARIANTLVSAGETVSGFGQMSRSHVYDVRLNGANVWVNGLGTFLNHSSHNGRTGFDYNAGGYALGADTIVDNRAVVGFAFGQSFGKQTPKSGNRFFDAGKIDMDSIMFGLYGGTSFNMKSPSDSMKLDAYASYGRFDNDSSHRSYTTGSMANASWKENAYAVGATLTRVHEVRENLFFSPFVSLDYIYADMDSVTETAAQSISYEGTAYQNLSLSLGTGLTRVYHLDGGQELSPYVSVAYVGDLIRKDAKVTSRNATGALIERSVSPGRNAFQVNVGSGWKITEQWGARIGYTAEFRSGATDQGVTVGVSYAF